MPRQNQLFGRDAVAEQKRASPIAQQHHPIDVVDERTESSLLSRDEARHAQARPRTTCPPTSPNGIPDRGWHSAEQLGRRAPKPETVQRAAGASADTEFAIAHFPSPAQQRAALTRDCRRVIGKDQPDIALVDHACETSRYCTGECVQVDDVRLLLVDDSSERAARRFVAVAIHAADVSFPGDGEAVHGQAVVQVVPTMWRRRGNDDVDTPPLLLTGERVHIDLGAAQRIRTEAEWNVDDLHSSRERHNGL